MSRIRFAAVLIICLLLGAGHSLKADVRADEKVRFQLAVVGTIVNIFGGKGAREGVTSTVAVKGSRKITTNSTTGQIIDLSEEKIYDLDMKKKTYTVTTFAGSAGRWQRRSGEAARRRGRRGRGEAAPSKGSSKPAAPPARDPNQKDVEVDLDVKNTGQTKTVNGFDTHETIVTVTVREKGKTLEQSGGLVMTSDMWLAPKIAAMKEIADFDMKYAAKLYGPMVAGASAQDMASAMAMYPMIKPALAKMNAEGGKIDGTPIMTTVTMDAVKSPEEMAQEQKQQTETDSSSDSSGGGIGGRLFGGLAKKMAKKDDEPKTRSTFLTTTTEVLKVTTEVAATDVAVPAGFKESK